MGQLLKKEIWEKVRNNSKSISGNFKAALLPVFRKQTPIFLFLRLIINIFLSFSLKARSSETGNRSLLSFVSQLSWVRTLEIPVVAGRETPSRA